jgi:hypothetical protein
VPTKGYEAECGARGTKNGRAGATTGLTFTRTCRNGRSLEGAASFRRSACLQAAHGGSLKV